MAFFSSKPECRCEFSPDAVYRHSLRIWWDEKQAAVCFIMLNPSTANEEKLDATVRRCIGFARRWGYGGFVIVNLYDFRTAYPEELDEAETPESTKNWKAVLDAVHSTQKVICAWGDHAGSKGVQVARELMKRKVKLFVLGLTRSGNPKHPVRLPYAVELMEWQP